MEATFQDLVGKTITHIAGNRIGSDEIFFHCADGSCFRMYHEWDCCECVELNDVTGDWADVIGIPILKAEESSNSTEPPPEDLPSESYTWTFYSLRTVNGAVDLRWYGQSNGYYSEHVSFERIEEQK